MRRSRSSRLFAALFAPWFAISMAEPVPIHDCPVHPSRVHAMARMSAPAVDRAPAGAEHSARADRHDAKGHGTAHQCCCLGACCASAPATIAAPPQLLQCSALPRHEAAYSTTSSTAQTVAEHVLPFANGPPATRV